MEEQYISIAEFAEITGTTRQAVYQRLNKSLKKYVKTVDNKKMLNTKALEDIYSVNLDKECKGKCKGKCKEVDKDCKGDCKGIDSQTQQLIDMLQTELEIKNNQIKELNTRLSEAHNLLDQEQKLNAKRALELEQKETKQKELEVELLEEHQKSWWQKLIGR